MLQLPNEVLGKKVKVGEMLLKVVLLSPRYSLVSLKQPNQSSLVQK